MTSNRRAKKKRRPANSQAPLYTIKINRTSLDHLLLGKCADIDKVSNVPSIPHCLKCSSAAAGVAPSASRPALDLHSQQGRLSARPAHPLRRVYHFNRMQRLRLHPFHAPVAGMRWLFLGRLIRHAAIRAVIADMRTCAARIPIQKKTRPTVVVHWLSHTWWGHGNFQDAHKRVLKNNFVTVWRGLHCIVAIGKVRSVLRVPGMTPARHTQSRNHQHSEESYSTSAKHAWQFHVVEYSNRFRPQTAHTAQPLTQSARNPSCLALLAGGAIPFICKCSAICLLVGSTACQELCGPLGYAQPGTTRQIAITALESSSCSYPLISGTAR